MAWGGTSGAGEFTGGDVGRGEVGGGADCKPPNMRIDASTARSILVVEDDPDIAMALQDLLEFEGFHVDCAQTCRQAFSSIEQNAYHAILLDLGLPDGDGCSILEKLQVSHPTLPVIVLTASHRNLGSLRAYARLTKPWEREELCAILRHAIGMA